MSDQTKLFSKQKEKLIKIGTTYYFNKDDDVNTKSKYTCMISLDTFLSVCVITPLVISNWHGVWTLFDLHADFFPPYETYAFANCILICWTFIRQILHEWFDKLQDRYQNAYIWQVFIQVYIVHFNVMVNMQWRAVFIIFDIITGLKMTPAGASGDNDTMPVWVFTIISTIALIILRGLRNTLAVPFILALDHPTGVFHFPTRFRTQLVQKTSLYILDCLFSVLIVGTLVVFVWRGAWVLIDIYLFPENEAWSAWASLAIGYMVVAIAFLLQPVMRWLCDRLNGAIRLLAADVFLLFSLLGTVNVWRGIWNLLNIYFLPENMELSCWITHWVSLILLILLGCSNSLLVRGVYIDAEEPAGKCVVFPCYYLRLIFQQEREKKHKNGVQMVSATKIKQEKQEENDNHVVAVNIDAGNHI